MQSGRLLPRQPPPCANLKSARHSATVICRSSQTPQKSTSGSDAARQLVSAGLATCISLSTLFGVSSTNDVFGSRTAEAAVEVGQTATVEQRYEQHIQHRRPRSHLPSSDEAAALQVLVDRDLFTEDAWQGMIK